MDFITGLPSSRGYTVILVVVDRLTKFSHFGLLPTSFTAEKTATLFLDMVVKLHGFPASITSDRDPIFLSAFWQQLFKLSGTTLKHSTAFHPQTDGQTEVTNRTIEQYLRAFTLAQPVTWAAHLGWAEFCLNTSYCHSIRMTPFEALFGRQPQMIPFYTAGTTKIQALDELLQQRDTVLRQLKENLRQAQFRMKQQANRHRRDLEFQVGDQVLVRLQPYRQISVRGRQAPKLAQRYYGPFPVTERIGKVAYRLELPQSSRIHPVFHISKLRRFISSGAPPTCTLPAESFDSRPAPQPLAICGERQILTPAGTQRQVLVQWQGEPPEHSSWEAYDQMKR